MLLSATLLYVVEGDLQPEAFGSIPRALWVSSAALLSTGYGDYTPITFLGRFAAVCTALFGIGAVALPAVYWLVLLLRERENRIKQFFLQFLY